MEELIGTEQMPETAIARRQVVTFDNLLLQPIDMVVKQKFAERDGAGEQKRAWNQHQINERCEGDMDAGMDETAWMAVSPFVQVLGCGVCR